MSFAMQSPPPMQAQSHGDTVPAAQSGSSGSISQLVQALQSGSINKQQLYASLTNMYKGQTPIAGSPVTTNSSFQPFHATTSAPFTPQEQQPAQPQQYQDQYQQQQQQPQSSPPYHSPTLAPSSQPTSGGTYSAEAAAAAQAHIQAYLARRLANPASANSSFAGAGLSASNASISAILQQSQQQLQQHYAYQQQQQMAQQHGQQQTDQSLNLSSHSFAQQGFSTPSSSFTGMDHSGMQGQYQGGNGGGVFSPPNFSYEAGQAAYMQQQQQQQQPQQDYGQPQYGLHLQGGHGSHAGDSGEAEEYDGNQRGSVFGGDDGASVTSRGGGSQSGRHQGQGQQSYPTRNTARLSVRERMAQVWTEEKNAELTFKPAITPLPRHLYKSRNRGGGVDDSMEEPPPAPFLGRVMHWSETKKARERQLLAESERRALAECTFHPRVNDESVAIVEAPGSGHRRLFSARSTARAKILELEVRREEEEKFRQSCTFEPALNQKSMRMAHAMAVRPRPSGVGGLLLSGNPPQQSSQEAELAACTFAPRVNPVKSDMRAAHMYLEQNAFERLSSVKHAPHSTSKSRRREESGYESEGSSATGRSRGRDRHRRGSTGGGGGSASARSLSQDARSTSSARSSSQAPPGQFQEFLARLKLKEMQRQEKLDALKLAEQAAVQHGRPMLSKKSAKIVQQSMEAGTYAPPAVRSSLHASQRAALDVPASAAAAAAAADPECTFAPSINPYSQTLSRRTAAQMSALEMARRAHNLQIKQGEMLQQEMEEATFQPELNRNTRNMAHVDSRLRVLSEPDLYLERVQFQASLRAAEVARQQQLRAEAEVQECTFAPAVHEAPPFVQRMARSMVLKRAQGHTESSIYKGKAYAPPPGKQDWK